MSKYGITKFRGVIGVTIIFVIFVVLAWLIYTPTPALKESQKIHIASGEGLAGIAAALKERGLVRSSAVFMLYVSAQGWEKNLKAGDYTIPAGSALNDIASQIAGGRGVSTDIEVFIPEGFNVWEIDKRLADEGLIVESKFAVAYGSREGYLFPDTYRFKPESLLGEIEQKMETNGQARTQELLGLLNISTKDRILTIASIIEKEARTESDMQLVSGVISNRLKRGMHLEIDATVTYGACLRKFQIPNSKFHAEDCDVTQIPVGKEIKIDSSFNTYTRAGLPPRPISNPGLTAIKAALNPKGDYLYYLSTRDGSRTIFSKTSAEHARNRHKHLGL